MTFHNVKIIARRQTSQKAGAFTLMEMIIVIAVLAIVSSLVIVMMSGAESHVDLKLAAGECAAIRDAIQKFQTDMGQSPEYIAELIQPPDQWRWRSTAVESAMHSYDPVTRRGWSGPYLSLDNKSADDDATCEIKITGASSTTNIQSTSTNSLTILKSRYDSAKQVADSSGRTISHYMLDFSQPNAIVVRFVCDPTQSPSNIKTLVSARLEIPQ